MSLTQLLLPADYFQGQQLDQQQQQQPPPQQQQRLWAASDHVRAYTINAYKLDNNNREWR